MFFLWYCIPSTDVRIPIKRLFDGSIKLSLLHAASPLKADRQLLQVVHWLGISTSYNSPSKDPNYPFKGPVCQIKGALVAEMGYDIHKYVYISV